MSRPDKLVVSLLPHFMPHVKRKRQALISFFSKLKRRWLPRADALPAGPFRTAGPLLPADEATSQPRKIFLFTPYILRTIGAAPSFRSISRTGHCTSLMAAYMRLPLRPRCAHARRQRFRFLKVIGEHKAFHWPPPLPRQAPRRFFIDDGLC